MLSASRFASRLIENQCVKRSFSTLLRNVSDKFFFKCFFSHFICYFVVSTLKYDSISNACGMSRCRAFCVIYDEIQTGSYLLPATIHPHYQHLKLCSRSSLPEWSRIISQPEYIYTITIQVSTSEAHSDRQKCRLQQQQHQWHAEHVLEFCRIASSLFGSISKHPFAYRVQSNQR